MEWKDTGCWVEGKVERKDTGWKGRWKGRLLGGREAGKEGYWWLV